VKGFIGNVLDCIDVIEHYWDLSGYSSILQRRYKENLVVFVFPNVQIFTFRAIRVSHSYSVFHTVYIDQPTNQQFTHAEFSVSVTLSTGNLRQMNIFIDVLCPAFHSLLLICLMLKPR
jgi:hypothetical protein